MLAYLGIGDRLVRKADGDRSPKAISEVPDEGRTHMRVFGRVLQLICGLVLVVLGFAWGEAFLAAGIFGLLIVAWAIWDIYKELTPDRKRVANLDSALDSLVDDGAKESGADKEGE